MTSHAPTPGAHAPWQSCVTSLITAVDSLDALNASDIEPRPGPGYPVTFVEINTIEHLLAHRLPLDYQGLLLAAGGWPRMCDELHLLSTADLIEGALHERAVEAQCLIEGDLALGERGIDWMDLMPIAVSTASTDVASLVVTGEKSGCVVWAHDGKVTVYSNTRTWLEGLVVNAMSLAMDLDSDQ